MRNRSVLIYAILFVFITAQAAYAESGTLTITHNMQYEYASSLMEEGDYNTAIIEFKRFVHFFPDSSHKLKAKFNIASCRFLLKDFHQAAREFNDIILEDRDPEITRRSVFLQSQAFSYMENTGYARLLLQNYLKLTDDPHIKNQIYFNLAMLHLKEATEGKVEALSQAEAYLNKISLDENDTYLVAEYNRLVDEAKNVSKKNPTAAGIFAIIPGGGFLYCERYKDALVTFLLNVGLMIGAYQAWDNDNEALAGVIAFVETGFYTANIYGAVSSAHKYNRAQVNKILGRDFHLRTSFNTENNGMQISFTFPF